MKKYKLIKIYPGSPELDTIITQKKNGTYEINNIVESANEVVNYPEFWQEIVEKDYEILNYSKPSNRFSISLLKRNSSWDIHSVKRLSDGEIFTIGDEYYHRTNPKDKLILDNFNIENDLIYLNEHKHKKFESRIDNVTKFKKPLFTTEDGVDIYDKKTIVTEVIVGNFHINERIPLGGCNCIIYNTYELQKEYQSKVFSTKEAAEEYILMNKPCLSINDLCKEVPTWSTQEFMTFSRVKELVKSKI